MADKRMFSKVITESDAFLDLPLSTQALYFHLGMQGDDDGFISSPKKIMRMIGAAQNEYDLLNAKNFIIEFADGIIVLKHWQMHNYIRKDRYKETVYMKQKDQLFIKQNKAYTLDSNQGLPVGIPVVDVDKSSLDKNRLGKIKINKSLCKESLSSEEPIKPDQDEKEKEIVKKVLTRYETQTGKTVSSIIVEGLLKWCDDIGHDLVMKSIEIAVKAGKPNYNYMAGIMKNFVADGIKTVEDLDNQSTKKKPSSNKFINHEQHTYDFDAIEAKNEALLDKINGE